MQEGTRNESEREERETDGGQDQRRRSPLPIDWSGVLARQGYVFGVDIAGDGERVVLCDLHGRVVGRDAYERRAGEAQQPEEVLERVRGMMRGLLEAKGVHAREVLRIGVGFGGPVDARAGNVRLAHDNPGWEGLPVAGRLEAHFDVPTLLDNDARLAALGEVWFGVGAGDSECNLVYLHWSTGVGGGIVAGGKLLRGATTMAGEIGHTVVRTKGDGMLQCRCGGRGHLEAYVRAVALVERARALVGAGAPAHGELLDAAAVFEAAGSDARLGELVDEAVEMMAVTVANLITSFNPKLMVIGGRVARHGAHLIPRIAELASQYAMPVSARDVAIVPAALGEDSTVMGAVALGLDSLR